MFSDIEQQKLAQIATDKVMRSALNKLLLHAIYTQGVNPIEKNFALDLVKDGKSDEELGQVLRAASVGAKLLEEAWRKIDMFKTPPPGLGAGENRAL